MAGSNLAKLKQKLWDGSINVKITLNSKESNEQTETHHYYLTVRRNSYLQLYLPSILNYFKPHLLVPEWFEDLSGWWFEHGDDEVPLKWNYPIGLSFDLINNTSLEVWELTLNYRDYPKDYIIQVHDKKKVDTDTSKEDKLSFLQDYWVNQLKQACFMIHGSLKPIMSLSKEDSLKLWQSVVDHNSYNYSSVIEPAIIPSNASKFRNIPIRIYLPIPCNNVLQPLIDPLNCKTVGDLLQTLVPDLFTLGPEPLKLAYPIIQGILVPLDCPLMEIYSLFVYVDGFLHINVVIR